VSDYYDLAGQPIDGDQWMALKLARLRGGGEWSTPDDDPTRVGLTQHHGVVVSTTWIGIDHSWGQGPPVIFETMVFGGDLDGEQDRYATIEEARAGHHAMVARVWPGARRRGAAGGEHTP